MRFPHKPSLVPEDHVLYQYWGEQGYFRPTVEVVLRGPSGVPISLHALLDTGSPYICFDLDVAQQLGLSPPFPRQASGFGAGGDELKMHFPDDGAVQLLLSDWTTEHFVWSPLVAFIPTKAVGGKPKPTAILGFTGFFQFFQVAFLDTMPAPSIEISGKQTFPGRRGTGTLTQDIWRSGPPG